VCNNADVYLSDSDEQSSIKVTTHGLRGFGKKPMIVANFITLIAYVKLSF